VIFTIDVHDRTSARALLSTVDYAARRRDAFVVAGLDPLYVACEGRMVAIVPEPHVDGALEALRGCATGEQAACIGTVQAAPAGMVALKTGMGSRRLLDLLTGEQLPQIS
jgi:hydrogenase expression/formation protein HypE